MITPLEEAARLWLDPTELIELWETQSEKHQQEKYITSRLKGSGIVADLGCGVGRYAGILDHKRYYGFDSSLEMIQRAKALHPHDTFACVDIFNFSSDRLYDNCLLIDVAYHQRQPIEALKVILQNWQAKRYLMTILVGQEPEQLLNSTVVSYAEFERFTEELRVVTYYTEPMGSFDWVLLDIIR